MENKVANNIIRIPTSLSGNFFRYWFEFLRPIHNLTTKEIEVTSALLKRRFMLSRVVKDQDILDQVLFNDESKSIIKKECGISTTYYQVLIGALKRKKIIINNKFNPKYIPNLINGDQFKLLLLFDLQHE